MVSYHTRAYLACVQDVVGEGMKRGINSLLLMLFVTSEIKKKKVISVHSATPKQL